MPVYGDNDDGGGLKVTAALVGDLIINLGHPFGCWGNAGLGCCGFIVLMLMCFFVMVDADRRDQPGCLWAIIVFFTNVVGLLVYLIVVAFSDHRR
jgi:hypothetical protein